jgi:sulfate adenylyltransferase subunit 1
MSALKGDNVVDRSDKTPWYEGPTLLYKLETLHVSSDFDQVNARFPVQTVIRPHSDEHHDFRGYAGRIAGGVFKPGDDVIALPSGFTSKIKSIVTYDGEVKEAFAPMSVTMTLEDEIDISRGDMLARPNNQPEAVQDLDVMLCWMNQKDLVPRGKYAIKHTTQEIRGMVKEVVYKVDINTLHRIEDDKTIKMNDIARVKIRTTKPVLKDAYNRNRNTGSLILIDEATNETVAAGMIL